jgi:hypothetical protein
MSRVASPDRARHEETTMNDLTTRPPQPGDQDWLALLHTLVNLAEKQGRAELALRLSVAADAAGDFVPGGAR